MRTEAISWTVRGSQCVSTRSSRGLSASWSLRVSSIATAEVWNEPDLTSFWKRQPKAADYVDLVRLTAAPLREEQPDAVLIGGAIAWGMTVWSLKFLEDCMKAGLHELVDIITYHGYKSVPERHSAQGVAAFKQTFHYGVLRLDDGSPKPAYYALQTLATLLCDPMESAGGRTSCHMSVLDDTDDPRATKANTWHANFTRGDVPVHAWWIPESVEDDPVLRRAEMNYWLDGDLRLENPVLIER